MGVDVLCLLCRHRILEALEMFSVASKFSVDSGKFTVVPAGSLLSNFEKVRESEVFKLLGHLETVSQGTKKNK